MDQLISPGHLPISSTVWRLSLISFMTAALTGFLYRFGMIIPLPEVFEFSNIRHAHSHLMFFNWVCPPFMVWMYHAAHTSDSSSAHVSFAWCMYTMMGLGFISFPFFLLYGYQPVQIGSAGIPVAAVISGLIMVTWYWFAWIYFNHRKATDRHLSVHLFDAAVIALIISSLGAWGVSVFQFIEGTGTLLTTAMTSFFLSVFTEGWVVLAVLGILYSLNTNSGEAVIQNTGWYYVPILFGSMLIFPFSINKSLLSGGMLIAAYCGLILSGGGLALHLWRIRVKQRQSGLVQHAIPFFMLLKIVFMAAAVLPLGIWPGEHGLRVLYLHTLLLGLASVVLIEAFHRGRDKMSKGLFVISVYIILITLAAISGYMPESLRISGLYHWVMMAAFLPSIPAAMLLFSDLGKFGDHQNKLSETG